MWALRRVGLGGGRGPARGPWFGLRCRDGCHTPTHRLSPQKVDVTSKAVTEVLARTIEYLQPNPGGGQPAGRVCTHWGRSGHWSTKGNMGSELKCPWRAGCVCGWVARGGGLAQPCHPDSPSKGEHLFRRTDSLDQ